MYLQSLLSRAAHWKERRALENASTGDHKTRLLSLGSTLSGLWLQVVPSQPRHRMAPATFRFAIRAYLGLPLPGCSPPTLRMCPVCHAQVDTIGTHWLSTCPTSRAAFTRRHTALNHTVRAAFHRAGYSTTLEPQLFDPTPETGNVGLWADLLVFATEGLPDCFVDVAVTCPTAPSYSTRAQSRRGTAAARKFQEKMHKYERAVHRQPGSLGLRPEFVPLVWETFGASHPKSHSWLCHMLRHVPLIRDDLLKELSWTLWRSTGSLFERASRQLSWSGASIASLGGSDMEL